MDDNELYETPKHNGDIISEERHAIQRANRWFAQHDGEQTHQPLSKEEVNEIIKRKREEERKEIERRTRIIEGERGDGESVSLELTEIKIKEDL